MPWNNGLCLFFGKHFPVGKLSPIQNSIYPTDIFFIAVSPIVIVFAAILVAHYSTTGNHSIAWILFFRGEVNFLWITVTLGVICVALADTVFLVERCLEIFSASSLANLFFAWKWILFAFGAYSHIRIFGAKPMQ